VTADGRLAQDPPRDRRPPARTLWSTIGWCGKPPKDETRTFVLISVGLTLGCWIIVPVLVGIALAT
jgi:hypothetical protein